MNQRIIGNFSVILLVFVSSFSLAQTQTPDLGKLFRENKITLVNRKASLLETDSKVVLHLSDQPDAGIAWLAGAGFRQGTVEFDVKGKDILQKSFVGLAFHGSDDHTYDAIYLRPFNFKSPEEERRNHSVQYISLPGNDWPKLRSDFPNQYEQPLNPSPEPDGWVHCRIVVKGKEVLVFVNQSLKASLTVKKLGNFDGNKIGFWVGNGSEGDFANLKITEQ